MSIGNDPPGRPKAKSLYLSNIEWAVFEAINSTENFKLSIISPRLRLRLGGEIVYQVVALTDVNVARLADDVITIMLQIVFGILIAAPLCGSCAERAWPKL